METERFGEEIAEQLHPGSVILLFGEMGAGKTTLARGICRALGVEKIKSPSFIIVNVYDGEVPIYHIDLYRLCEMDNATAGEIEEYIWRGDGIKIIEWADRLPKELIPKNALRIRINKISHNERHITIEV